MPQANVSYWSSKLERNQLRDRQVDLLLTDAGWTVLRIWEHVPAEEAAETVSARLRNQ
jgi:DNA mismatch endonuclease (patch repair protein)